MLSEEGEIIHFQARRYFPFDERKDKKEDFCRWPSSGESGYKL